MTDRISGSGPRLRYDSYEVHAMNEKTLPQQKPHQAVTLFDGIDLSEWVSREGGPAAWLVRDGYMEVVAGTGDIHTKQLFHDFHLHIEFWLPFMPHAKGQARANSGIYLQGLYEIQVLDSFGIADLQDNDCGALYKVLAPTRNACEKPETWQSFDFAFRAPKFDSRGALLADGRLTAFLNGVLIHNNRSFQRPTPRSLNIAPGQPGPILLQDHGDPVRFRNIWILPDRPG